ncbi:MAG TPA: nicotinate phosphoribosyltransferase [Anaerolineales bacterium]|nr:nicotinate phosphoribosyltransferase [Anaerolineales bacterium]
MSVFDGRRLGNEVFKLDVDRMRRGWYSDKYFTNIARMLSKLAAQGYSYAGEHARRLPVEGNRIPTGDIEVEMQWFTRRQGTTLVVGVDKALAMLRHCAGAWESERFLEAWDRLEVHAVQDGSLIHSVGDLEHVQPVLRVRGRYRDFALLETPTLGVLTRGSRVATNVYETLMAARGKPVLFFPARFDAHEVQAADGYAYNLAVQRFNLDFAGRLGPFVSTDAQGDWWGGVGSGTVAHAAIACFLGDTAEAMWAFASTLPPEIPRIALVDFNNDSVADSLSTVERMFRHYRACLESGDESGAKRFILFGVRLDTSASIRDISVPPQGDNAHDLGVSPRLVETVRRALDRAWEGWGLSPDWIERAKDYCRSIKIVVSGGFTAQRIDDFERHGVPVDIYAVGSALFTNAGPTVTDFTADVVRVRLDRTWIPMAKVGRAPGENPELERVV